MSDYLQMARDKVAESLDPEMQARYKKRRADAMAQQEANYQGPEAINALQDGQRLHALQTGLTRAANKFGSVGGDGGAKTQLGDTLGAMDEADQGAFKMRQSAFDAGVKAEDAANEGLTGLSDRALKLGGIADQAERTDVTRGREDDAYGRSQDLQSQEDDPNSEISRSYQALASKMTGGKDFAGVSASRLKSLQGTHEKLYGIDENRKSRLESNKALAGQREDARAARIEDRDFARQNKLEDEKRRQDEKDPTRDQSDASLYANRIDNAEKVFSDLEKGGYNRADKSSALGAKLPGFIQSYSSKSQEVAEKNFLTAALRRESGASIAPSEFASGEQIYFPRAGDSQAVIEQKRANRKSVLDSLRNAAGKPGARSLTHNSDAPVDSVGGSGGVTVHTRGSIPEAD